MATDIKTKQKLKFRKPQTKWANRHIGMYRKPNCGQTPVKQTTGQMNRIKLSRQVENRQYGRTEIK